MRRRLERAEDRSLGPWALRSAGAERRHGVEDEGRAFDYRTEFQRDRDRIVYSRAFRRLRQKAVTGILPAYEDHRRNRLTHTIEVAQLARTIGRALRLNEDLVEAVALGHDLGQPPFGPAGARALDDLLSGRLDGRGGPGLGDLGGFHRSVQALRVVDLIEKRYDHPGINLTDPVREGVLKAGFDRPEALEGVQGVRPGLPPAFEVQVVRLADRIASALHDLDDALHAGSLDLAAVERLRIVAELRRKLGVRYPQKSGRFMKANAIHRGLIHLLATGAILSGQTALARWAARHAVKDAERFREVRDGAVNGREISLGGALSGLLEDLEGFLVAKVHRGFEADRVEGRGRRIVTGLFAAYQADPTLLDDHTLLRYKEVAAVRYLRDVPRTAVGEETARRYRRDPRFARVLADHLAAMTDAYAVAEHAKLLETGAVPIPSAEQLRREETT
jgi:dGTPase